MRLAQARLTTSSAAAEDGELCHGVEEDRPADRGVFRIFGQIADRF
jgi:hypothetical protein